MQESQERCVYCGSGLKASDASAKIAQVALHAINEGYLKVDDQIMHFEQFGMTMLEAKMDSDIFAHAQAFRTMRENIRPTGFSRLLILVPIGLMGLLTGAWVYARFLLH